MLVISLIMNCVTLKFHVLPGEASDQTVANSEMAIGTQNSRSQEFLIYGLGRGLI